MSALTREKELELKHAIKEYEAQLRRLQDELGSKAKKKESQVLEQYTSPGHLSSVTESQGC